MLLALVVAAIAIQATRPAPKTVSKMTSFYSSIIIKDSQTGFLIENGLFKKVLRPGKYRFWQLGTRREVKVFDCQTPRMEPRWAKLVEEKAPDAASRLFEIVQTGADQVAIVYLDEKPFCLVGPWEKQYYYRTHYKVEADYIAIETGANVPKDFRAVIEKLYTDKLVQSMTVPHSHTGLMFVDGRLDRTLDPGAHSFWQNEGKISFELVDLRPQQLEVTAQEILTKDKISLRVTLSAFVTVKDAQKTVESSADYKEHLYRLVQFAVREAVGNRSLDEVLNNREKIDHQIRDHVRSHMGDIGVSLDELGIKDIILPGEMREMLNKVVEAEKTAQANLIRRREETAATRSLLNTAKLMDNNPTLMRLKELEALEKLTEKVGRIDLHAGDRGGFDALLSGLVRIREDGA